MILDERLPPLPVPDGVEVVPARIPEDLTRDEWLELRHGGLGGSDASAIIGANQYSTPFQVWVDKCADKLDWIERPTNDTFEGYPSEAAYWGVQLEDLVAQAFARRTGLTVVNPQIMLWDHRLAFPRFANPDRLVWDPELAAWVPLEIKTVSAYKAEDWAKKDEPADHAHAQVVHYGAVLGVSYAWVAVLIGGQRMRPMRVKISPRLAEDIEALEAQFWADHVVPLVPPPADTPDYDFIQAGIVRIGAGAPTLGTDAVEVWESWLDAHQKVNQADAAKKAAAAQLKLLLVEPGEGESAVVGFARGAKLCGWGKEPEPSTTITADGLRAMQKAHPRIYKKYAVENTPRRRFLVNAKWTPATRKAPS